MDWQAKRARPSVAAFPGHPPRHRCKELLLCGMGWRFPIDVKICQNGLRISIAATTFHYQMCDDCDACWSFEARMERGSSDRNLPVLLSKKP